jgi:hypothetical protein
MQPQLLHFVLKLLNLNTMTLKFLIIPFLLLLVSSAYCQTVNKMKFSSVTHAGLSTGSNGDAFVVQTINGIKKDKWFAGLGVGLDFYRNRTVPLFVDIRRDLFSTPNTPFIYADAGVNFLMMNFIQKEQSNFTSSSPGLFYDAGIGWKLKIKHERALIFSAGYSLKQVKQKSTLWWGAPTIQLQEQNYEHYNFLYRRLVFKMGIQL